MATQQPRILMVEDDERLGDTLAAGLRAEGYDVHLERSGNGIGDVAARFSPDLAVLDVRLSEGPSGFGVAERLRETDDVPIIFLTAADSLDDRLVGFRSGADDYLVKPIALAELAARIRALLRRSGRLSDETWTVGDLRVDEAARTVVRAGEPLVLTRTEFDLLVVLGRNRGRVLSKAQLLTMVWGFEEYDPNLVEVYVSGLRKKLEAQGPRLIQTVRGVGYTLRA